ncbi:RNA-guided endonuclease InsQ/TnpB family protein [Actinacidiphila acididurans]|uniref:Transposase n=1 Tax=Actinacidiphila acididurans TaxID=2784346 RepID=A0ABS2TML8_9ACTN|nr:zinc ribbon domain-containing protein [Actinacidiphila acididurans]MBM9503726.1 transposase [Actinacidiphila acididurans]
MTAVTTPTQRNGEDSGRARYTCRLRVSSTARSGLEAEWSRCRWIWNECAARSKKAYADGEECGPAALDRMLTQARAHTPWLADGSSVPQQQIIRDFGKARAKALKDIRDRLPVRRRAGMPKPKKKREAPPTLNYTQRGFGLRDGRLHLAGGIVVTVVWSRSLPADPSSVRVYRDSLGHWYASFVVPAQTQPLPVTGRVLGVDWGVKETATTTSDDHDLPHAEHGRKAAQRLAHDTVAVEDFRPKFLAHSTMARKAADAGIAATKTALIEMGRKHGRDIRLVNPAHTTMDCASCGARTKHALPLSERTYTCTRCGAVFPRDKNSARVMLLRAGLNPAGVEGARPVGAPLPQAA